MEVKIPALLGNNQPTEGRTDGFISNKDDEISDGAIIILSSFFIDCLLHYSSIINSIMIFCYYY